MIKQRLQAAMFFLILLTVSTTAFGSSNPEIYLSAPQKTAAGDEFVASLLIQNIPPVYGQEIELTYDSKLIEVKDAEVTKEGIQITPGEFFDIQKAFILINKSDNSNGVIRYAMSLLNPAPSSEGNGALMHITFKAKEPGKASVRIEKVKLGTKDGRTLVPTIRTAETTVEVTSQMIPHQQIRWMIAFMIAAIIIACIWIIKKSTKPFEIKLNSAV